MAISTQPGQTIAFPVKPPYFKSSKRSESTGYVSNYSAAPHVKPCKQNLASGQMQQEMLHLFVQYAASLALYIIVVPSLLPTRWRRGKLCTQCLRYILSTTVKRGVQYLILRNFLDNTSSTQNGNTSDLKQEWDTTWYRPWNQVRSATHSPRIYEGMSITCMWTPGNEDLVANGWIIDASENYRYNTPLRPIMLWLTQAPKTHKNLKGRARKGVVFRESKWET